MRVRVNEWLLEYVDLQYWRIQRKPIKRRIDYGLTTNDEMLTGICCNSAYNSLISHRFGIALPPDIFQLSDCQRSIQSFPIFVTRYEMVHTFKLRYPFVIAYNRDDKRSSSYDLPRTCRIAMHTACNSARSLVCLPMRRTEWFSALPTPCQIPIPPRRFEYSPYT